MSRSFLADGITRSTKGVQIKHRHVGFALCAPVSMTKITYVLSLFSFDHRPDDIHQKSIRDTKAFCERLIKLNITYNRTKLKLLQMSLPECWSWIPFTFYCFLLCALQTLHKSQRNWNENNNNNQHEIWNIDCAEYNIKVKRAHANNSGNRQKNKNDMKKKRIVPQFDWWSRQSKTIYSSIKRINFVHRKIFDTEHQHMQLHYIKTWKLLACVNVRCTPCKAHSMTNWTIDIDIEYGIPANYLLKQFRMPIASFAVHKQNSQWLSGKQLHFVIIASAHNFSKYSNAGYMTLYILDKSASRIIEWKMPILLFMYIIWWKHQHQIQFRYYITDPSCLPLHVYQCSISISISMINAHKNQYFDLLITDTGIVIFSQTDEFEFDSELNTQWFSITITIINEISMPVSRPVQRDKKKQIFSLFLYRSVLTYIVQTNIE